MQTRRILFKIAGLFTLSAFLPFKVALADNVIKDSPVITEFDHPLFASTRIDNAIWEKISLPETLPIEFDISKADIPGIDIDTEISNAQFVELVHTVEHKWLAIYCSVGPSGGFIYDTFKPNEYKEDFTFVSELHAKLGEMILKHALDDNTIIISPTVLTILQSGNSIVRDESNNFHNYDIGLKRIGKFGHLNVLLNHYTRDDTPIFIGYIDPDPSKRLTALVKINDNEYEFGMAHWMFRGYPWKRIEIDVSQLAFI